MNFYLKLILFFIAILFIYWLYKKYKNHKDEKNINYLKTAIKNNITITMYNMNKFLNLSERIKNDLISIAIKYKHDDIINLLKFN